MDGPADALSATQEEANNGEILLTVMSSNQANVPGDEVNVDGEDVEEQEPVEETTEEMLRRIVREELKQTLLSSAEITLNDLNASSSTVPMATNLEQDDDEAKTDPRVVLSRDRKYSKSKERKYSSESYHRRQMSQQSTNNVTVGNSEEATGSKKLQLAVEAMEAMDAVVTPERPSSVCGFCMTLILPIVFIVYLIVRLDQVYSAPPTESSYLVPSHGLHAPITIKCLPIGQVVTSMASAGSNHGPPPPEIKKNVDAPDLQGFDPASCNVNTIAGQKFNPKAPGNKAPTGGGGKTPTGGGGKTPSGGGGKTPSGGGGKTPSGGGGKTPSGGKLPPPNGGGGRRRSLLTSTSSSLNYCTVTVNYVQGLCGYERSNLTSEIINSDEVYPNENTDGDKDWSFTLDATGVDYPNSVEVPMCASSDNDDFIQINGNSDNTTKISIMNQIVYRDAYFNFYPTDWVKKNKNQIYSTYNPGELEIIPKSAKAQVLTLTRYNLTYYPKYLNSSNDHSIFRRDDSWDQNEAVSRIIWFGPQRDSSRSMTGGSGSGSGGTGSGPSKIPNRCESSSATSTQPGKPYVVQLFGQPMYQNYEKKKTVSVLEILSEIGGIFTILMLILGGIKTGTLLLSICVEDHPKLKWMVCLCSTHTERASKFYTHLSEIDVNSETNIKKHHRLEESLLWLDSMIFTVEKGSAASNEKNKVLKQIHSEHTQSMKKR